MSNPVDDISKYDALLGPFVSTQRDLPSVLRSFFGWLHARSDLYIVDTDPQRQMGFAAGEAEKVLLSAFRSFSFKEGTKKRVVAEEDIVPAAMRQLHSLATTTTTTTTHTASAVIVRYTRDGLLQIPEGNGGVGPGYEWGQTLNDISVTCLLPASTRVSDVVCTVSANHLLLRLRNATIAIIDAPLFAAVRTSEVEWNLESTDNARGRRIDVLKKVHEISCDSGTVLIDTAHALSSSPPPLAGRIFCLVIDKVIKTWWRSLTLGGPEIDASLVDSSQPVSSYDEETQVSLYIYPYIYSHAREDFLAFSHPTPPFPLYPTTQAAIRKIVYEQGLKNKAVTPNTDTTGQERPADLG